MSRQVWFTMLSLAVLSSPGVAFAGPLTTIQDNYIGGVPTNASFAGADVIGDLDKFDVSSATVSFDSGILTVVISSTYFDNVGALGTQLGDLFLSTNGWNPDGPAPFLNDQFGQGERMELAAVLDNHGQGSTNGEDFRGRTGTLALYNVDDANVVLSNANGIFRANQEVQYQPGSSEQAIAFGTWSIVDREGSLYDDLIFQIRLGAQVGLGDSLGFHWGMTCGNDVIEGAAPVPEPATLSLLALGAGGLALSGRKKRSAVSAGRDASA